MAAVSTITNITATLIPEAVFKLRDNEMKGHIPKRYVSAMLCVRIAAMNMVIKCNIRYASSSSDLVSCKVRETHMAIPSRKNAPGAMVITTHFSH